MCNPVHKPTDCQRWKHNLLSGGYNDSIASQCPLAFSKHQWSNLATLLAADPISSSDSCLQQASISQLLANVIMTKLTVAQYLHVKNGTCHWNVGGVLFLYAVLQWWSTSTSKICHAAGECQSNSSWKPSQNGMLRRKWHIPLICCPIVVSSNEMVAVAFDTPLWINIFHEDKPEISFATFWFWCDFVFPVSQWIRADRFLPHFVVPLFSLRTNLEILFQRLVQHYLLLFYLFGRVSTSLWFKGGWLQKDGLFFAFYHCATPLPKVMPIHCREFLTFEQWPPSTK